MVASRKVYVVGVGMSKFIKPRGQVDYPGMYISDNYHSCHYLQPFRYFIEFGLEATFKALNDAKLSYDSVEFAAVGYVSADSTAGQRVLHQLGMTQILIINVNNNCSTGSTALLQARNSVASSTTECALALGFERMKPGSLGQTYKDRTYQLGKKYSRNVVHRVTS